ncbi:ATP phosphoribosyltransferase regulatory subunit [Synechococcus sp. PCC 6312]|uniref:ATP phosphoribosyltransferase regulatory subunit n=1 Tax=Synechococcus sp. (strain ATCC 27167 / PCC 6312) TaxID=195253 RepID=UPI00029F079D|nr:ATP phosphoribosyltransferase regulatory subunit [Synechococcus sp. PCC 6312]AFY61625.1 ATP phosphoribosyltransferase, regulatory subunit [Synechococcus sp. PCC 6312]
MVYQPPTGGRDLLPLDVAQQRWIEHHLEQTFQRWGYHEIVTPTLERLDTLMAGGAVRPETVMQLQDTESDWLGLRPELTASIARAAVTRLAGTPLPQRLYYKANVFRRASTKGLNRRQEFFQAGVELIGGSGLRADAEILFLLEDCLDTLHLQAWSVLLGEAGLTQCLLNTFPLAWQPQIRHHLAQLDRVALLELPLPDEIRQKVLDLLNMRGPADQVMAKLQAWPLDQAGNARLAALAQLLGIIGDRLKIMLDLSLIQTFDYYTGIVWDVVAYAEGDLRVVAQGGRYDQLLGTYSPSAESQPGIGFVFNLENLQQSLASQGQLPQQPPRSQWLVVPTSEPALKASFAHAHTLRIEGDVRAEVALAPLSPDEMRDYAQRQQIPYIAWVNEAGQPTVEIVSERENVPC